MNSEPPPQATLPDDRPSLRAVNPDRKKGRKREFYEDWPWFGFPQAERIPASFWLWVTLLTVLAILIVLSLVTFHFIAAFVLIFVTAAVASLPFTMLKMDRI